MPFWRMSMRGVLLGSPSMFWGLWHSFPATSTSQILFEFNNDHFLAKSFIQHLHLSPHSTQPPAQPLSMLFLLWEPALVFTHVSSLWPTGGCRGGWGCCWGVVGAFLVPPDPSSIFVTWIQCMYAIICGFRCSLLQFAHCTLPKFIEKTPERPMRKLPTQRVPCSCSAEHSLALLGRKGAARGKV